MQSLENNGDQSLEIFMEQNFDSRPNESHVNQFANLVRATDGACEGERNKTGSIGAVLVNEDGQAVSYFSELVPTSWMRVFMEVSKHPVTELGQLPPTFAFAWKTLSGIANAFYFWTMKLPRGHSLLEPLPAKMTVAW